MSGEKRGRLITEQFAGLDKLTRDLAPPTSPSEAEELAKRLRREAHFHRNDPFELLNNDLAAELLDEAAALLRKQEEEKRATEWMLEEDRKQLAASQARVEEMKKLCKDSGDTILRKEEDVQSRREENRRLRAQLTAAQEREKVLRKSLQEARAALAEEEGK